MNVPVIKAVTEIIKFIDKLTHTNSIITPHAWFKNILLSNGKPDLIGINVLSKLVPLVSKQVSKEVQASYKQLSKLFGASTRQVAHAISRLEKGGILTRVFKNIRVNGIICSNVMFIEINPEMLKNISTEGGDND